MTLAGADQRYVTSAGFLEGSVRLDLYYAENWSLANA
jgi:hypothetical protein